MDERFPNVGMCPHHGRVDPVERSLAVLGDVVTRKQLLAHGCSPADVRRALRAGHLIPLHRGAYAARIFRPDVVARAALAAAGAGAVAAGLTALDVHRLSVLANDPVPEVIVAPASAARTRPSLRVRHLPLEPRQVTTVRGIPVTTVPTTIAHLASAGARAQAVIAAEEALRQRRVADLEATLRAGTRRVRDVLALMEPASESPLETLGRLLLVDGGLPSPEVQVLIRDERRRPVARVDLFYRKARVVIEFDGRGPHAQPDALFRDRERQNDLQRLGFRVLRFTWHDVTRRPKYVVVTVRAALAEAA